VLGSRTDGALEEESSWPNGTRAVLGSLAFAALCCSFGFTLSGCSAVSALAETHRAERALVSAQGLRETPATTYALTLSRAYLEKAREEAAEAQYGNAILFAKASTQAAEDAQRTQVAHLSFAPGEGRPR
jgi:branched-subunit amino acid aminotransferase/4-amino-4-deoxychorismate lyase